MRIIYATAVSIAIFSANCATAAPVWMQDMTWQEIDKAIKSGKTTVIVPTGGIEQNGPHLTLGKHNFILEKTAPAIAEKLGNALVAPIIPYVPEGNATPPEGHMRFAGTISMQPATFAAVLEDTAASLKQHGFKYICFIGEHGGSQAVQGDVAAKLSAQWHKEGVRVIQVDDYYDADNGQVAWAKKAVPAEKDIEAHGGFADTSEMLAVAPQEVRNNLRAPYAAGDYEKTGAAGSSVHASKQYGEKLLELKVEAAVKEIEKAEK
ncbi:MAG TPA: creatininase family protein [Rickettsiales bacterium]|nr:creatininase family protein [Rickettsiales bacterium]